MADNNTLTVRLFAVLAQPERKTISKRAKDALAAQKARGAVLGTPATLTQAVLERSRAIRPQNAQTLLFPIAIIV